MDNANSGIGDAVRFAAELRGEVEQLKVMKLDDGRFMTATLRHTIPDPSTRALELTTLTGLSDYLADIGRDGIVRDMAEVLVVVESPKRVSIKSRIFGVNKQRETYAEAEPVLPRFEFDRFIEPEEFIIGLNAMFCDSGDRDALVADVAKIKVNAGAQITDDGTSQTVAVEAGAVLLTQRKTTPRVTLAPFCTFAEIDQPDRQFLFRLDKEGRPGLFVADGDVWRNRVMESIKTWLTDRHPGILIIA